MDDEHRNTAIYMAVINDEDQYSLWPDDGRGLPLGWREAGKTGTKNEVLGWIQEVWTDMRPKSLREAMERDPGDSEN